ncbi:carboxypeptidase-like regulatory domain-containing protein [Planctellipticum variicoloris]|uniref:carboxypeptidase-like regulatory domain-containing protein n=1 Tax=Planctellipticum variicoloris TaxID=3064265 RepID=UPI0030138756|nr:carboxypeptidase-like regulatory domain-containing protein [Planctomycetaceae bacterium SH412]
MTLFELADRICGVRRLAVIVLLCAAGCGGGGDNTPRYPASGTVLLEGAPVDGAVVAFSREDGNATAVAMTDEMGQFQLNVPPGKRGVPAGKYRISVRKSSVAPTYKEPTTFEEMEKEHKAGVKPGPPPAPKLGVPARYGDPATSLLTEEVTPTGKNEFTIQLKG